MLLGRIPKPEEPYWLKEDTQAVLDYLREEKLRCPGCGLPRDETMDPEAQRQYRARALRCFACEQRDAKARQFTKTAEGSAGLYVVVERDGH